MKKAAILLGIVIVTAGCGSETTTDTGETEQIHDLSMYMQEHYQSPEEYLLSKFTDHDIVFVGERHRLRHDVKLIRDMIPLLYAEEIYNLGIEFANFQDQKLIDSVITAPEYDETLARQIQFNQWPFWGFQDYIDIYKAAWELNHDLPADARRFRVVGLNAQSDWSYVWTEEDRSNPEIMKKVWPYGGSDEHMAKIIMQEFVSSGDKALIYSGINHAYTRYHQPYQQEGEWQFNSHRMGNIVYDSIGDRCMLVCLHHPWPLRDDFGQSTYPVDTIIDKTMLVIPEEYRRVGFDVVGPPFGALPATTAYWSNGYEDFTLSDYCDGYIYQMPFHEYEGVEVAEGFINESNRKAAAAQSANPKTKDSTESVADLMNSMERDTEIQRIFGFYGLDKPLSVPEGKK